MSVPSNVHVPDHPFISHCLLLMRDRQCPHSQFRVFLNHISRYLAYEALAVLKQNASLPLEKVKVQSHEPNIDVTGEMIESRDFTLIPIMRAGLPMATAVLKILPNAIFGHIGIQRSPSDPKSRDVYFTSIPPMNGKICWVFDPIIATGATVIHALDLIRSIESPPRAICLLNVAASKNGLDAIISEHPEVQILTIAPGDLVAKDGRLVPGFGDAGDRVFGTEYDGEDSL